MSLLFGLKVNLRGSPVPSETFSAPSSLPPGPYALGIRVALIAHRFLHASTLACIWTLALYQFPLHIWFLALEMPASLLPFNPPASPLTHPLCLAWKGFSAQVRQTSPYLCSSPSADLRPCPGSVVAPFISKAGTSLLGKLGSFEQRAF